MWQDIFPAPFSLFCYHYVVSLLLCYSPIRSSIPQNQIRFSRSNRLESKVLRSPHTYYWFGFRFALSSIKGPFIARRSIRKPAYSTLTLRSLLNLKRPSILSTIDRCRIGHSDRLRSRLRCIPAFSPEECPPIAGGAIGKYAFSILVFIPLVYAVISSRISHTTDLAQDRCPY